MTVETRSVARSVNEPGWAVDWLKKNGHSNVSTAGARVAQLVNWIWDGIYHQKDAVHRARWDGDEVSLTIYAPGYSGPSTFDDSTLTRIVVGAHDAAIRVSIGAAGPHYIRITFSPRSRDGDTYHGHPTIESRLETLPRLTRAHTVESVS